MPLRVTEYPLNQASLDDLGQVLRDDPQIARALEALAGDDQHRLLVSIFNGRPVAALLVSVDGEHWRAEQLVVHPATRGRGVARELLRLAADQLPGELSLPAHWHRQPG